jgi:TPP-dependent pyruvate/acetoin dehydrogenase alpha subunit
MSGQPITITQALTQLDGTKRFADKAGQLTHLRWMILARVVDERTLSLYKSGELTGNAFLGKGHLRAIDP